MNQRNSRKRKIEESNEFMPLSKSKLVESDDDICEYDWGCKKSTKKVNIQEEHKSSNIEKPEDIKDNISKRFVYKSTNPLELKDDDKKIYLENLTKIYDRSFVYTPSLYDEPHVLSNTNKLVAKAIRKLFETEIKSISDTLENLWIPLNEHYVKTNRLSSNCSANKIIVKGLDQYSKANEIFEKCIDDCKINAVELKNFLTTWKSKDVESITETFRVVVGSILLKYKDEPEVSMNKMSQETNQNVFNGMVEDDLKTVKKRVEKVIKSRAKKAKKEESEESNNELEESESAVSRPATKAIMENRGLVPRRKKADANPRVKHRMKFKKAIVRYHSQVPRSRSDAANYEGEQSGIRIGVIKSKKLK